MVDYIRKNQKILMIAACIILALAMLARCFFGVDITDESYYISDAIAMVNGNLPYAYNNFSFGTGSAFLIIPQVFIYGLLRPDYSGVMLFTRLSFVCFWLAALVIVCHELKKRFKPVSVFLFAGILIVNPMGVGILNYSYNSIPAALVLLSGVLLNSVLEHGAENRLWKIFVSGFLMAVSCFAHLGYAVAAIVFTIIILVRSGRARDTISNIAAFALGAVSEVLIVMVPIGLQAGFDTLWEGLSGMLLLPGETKWLVIGASGVIVLALAVNICISFVKKDSKAVIKNILSHCEALSSPAVIAVAALGIAVSILMVLGRGYNWTLGFTGALGVLVLVVFTKKRSNDLLWYLGLYPILFSLAMMAVVDKEIVLSRLTAAIPCFALFLLLTGDSCSGRQLNMIVITGILSIVLSAIAVFTNVYRDESIQRLSDRVSAGVYKGLYTTKETAGDVIELECYLNQTISDTDKYSYRDNVPCAYLMTHKGKMWDIATWDCMNYTYGRNDPDILYRYYQRRKGVPDIIVYIDYGRDAALSIEEENYRYNEYVNSNYSTSEAISLNNTFGRVLVFRKANDD